MSKWLNNVLWFVAGMVVGPLVWQIMVAPLWRWSMDVGPELAQNAAGFLLFLVIILVIAVLTIVIVKFFRKSTTRMAGSDSGPRSGSRADKAASKYKTDTAS